MINKLPITALVLTYNEEKQVSDCLRSVFDWVGELIVVDSGSSDNTLAIAQQYGCQIHYHPFQTHAQQWHWTLQNLPIETDWVLGLDADQRITPELQQELSELFLQPYLITAIDGFYIKRRQIFQGQWIRYGGYYPKYMLKLFRKDKVVFDELDLLDHHFIVNGKTAALRHDLIEDNQKERDLDFWLTKHIRYAKLHAQEEFLRTKNIQNWQVTPNFWGHTDERVVWFKTLWYRLPLFWRSIGYFFMRYFIQLGFLDGKKGFIFHFLQAGWYRILVDIELTKLRENIT